MPSILIFRNISFLSTTEFHISNQAWNKTILSVQGHSLRSCNAVTPNCSCTSSLCSPSTPLNQIFHSSQTMFMSTWFHLPPPLIWQTCSQIGKHSKQRKIRKWQILEIDTFLMCFAIAIEAYNTGELKKWICCLGYLSPDSTLKGKG